MPRYIIVKEVIGEYVYEVEADDEEAAVALVRNGIVDPDNFEIVSTDGPISVMDVEDV